MVVWKSSFGNSCPALDIWFQFETDFNVQFAAPLLCGHHEMTGCFNYATTNSTCSRNFWNRCSCTRMCNVVPAAKSWVLVFKPANLRIGADLVRQASCKSSASSQKHQRQVKNVQNACKRTCTMLSHEQHRNAAYSEHTRKCFINICPFSWL